MLSPSGSGLSVLISECAKFAAENDILFNNIKTKLMYFKGRFCKPVKVGIKVTGHYVNIFKTAVHLGHTISSENKNKCQIFHYQFLEGL